jgi:glycerophosphoryl diester phosphodiesterase
MQPMIGFAHRGAPRPGIRENTLEAFSQALAGGATALESDVWLTADGVPVLVHDGVLRAGLRRRPIGALKITELPRWLPSLDALYTQVGTGFDLSLDVKDPAAAAPVIEVAARHGAPSRLWLCGSTAQVRSWHELTATDVHDDGPGQPPNLVVSTTLRGSGPPPAQRIGDAAAARATAVNLRAPEWTAQHVQECHDAGLLAFAWDVQRQDTLEAVRRLGIDAIFSDYIDLLTSV